MSMTDRLSVVIRGGGDLASGVALRLHRAGFRITVLEIPQPTVIRRAVALASAVYDGSTVVEGVTSRLVRPDDDLEPIWRSGEVPVVVDPEASILARLRPDALVDAIMAKRDPSTPLRAGLGTHIDDAPIVVALGPGFTAGVDCHAVVETNRGHSLGRVYYTGAAEANTGVPGAVGGQDALRVVHAPADGVFQGLRQIGEHVSRGDSIGRVGDPPTALPAPPRSARGRGLRRACPEPREGAGFAVASHIDGVLRGILHDGLIVHAGMKVADVDPRGVVEYCFTVSDKAWAVGGGVLEAILHLRAALEARLP
jgi:xanthine dehydrogenase accessory factor